MYFSYEDTLVFPADCLHRPQIITSSVLWYTQVFQQIDRFFNRPNFSPILTEGSNSTIIVIADIDEGFGQ